MKYRIFLCVLLLLIIKVGYNSTQKGTLIKEIVSENQQKKMNIYLGPSSNAIMVDCYIYVEIEDIKTKKKRKIFYEYHCDVADAYWIDNDIVCINGKLINIEKDFYNGEDGEDTAWPHVLHAQHINDIISPSKKYKAHIYYGMIQDTCLKENTVAVEIEDLSKREKHNVYYSYGELSVNAYWINNNTLFINGKILSL